MGFPLLVIINYNQVIFHNWYATLWIEELQFADLELDGFFLFTKLDEYWGQWRAVCSSNELFSWITFVSNETESYVY